MSTEDHARSDGRTLLDEIWDAAGRGGTLTILGRRDRQKSRTFAELVDLAEAATRGLAERGVGPGQRVGVVVTPSFDAVAGVLAVWRAGATLVIVPPPERIESRRAWGERVAGLLSRADVRLTLSARPIPTLPDSAAVRLGDLAVPGGSLVPGPAPADAALIKFTSGTTSSPRAILKSHASILAGARSSAATKGGFDPQVDHRFGWTPLYRQALGSDVLYPMAAGVDATLLPTDLFTARPLLWLTGISRFRATHSAGPTFAYRLVARQLEAAEQLDLDLSCWRMASCGGEAVDAESLERFAEAAAPYGFDPAALCPSYGTSETGGITARRPGAGLKADVVERSALASGEATPASAGEPGAVLVMSVGAPRSDVRVKVVDELGAEQRERRVGEIVVSTPALMDGYLDDPEASAAVIHDGWCRTGDLGYFAGGELHITGRIKDVIIINGQNYYATDIEQLVASVDQPGAGLCAAIGVQSGGTEALVLVIEADGPDAALGEAVNRIVWQGTGLAPKDVILVPRGSLPRTGNGKLQRNRVRAAYEAGHLPALA